MSGLKANLAAHDWTFWCDGRTTESSGAIGTPAEPPFTEVTMQVGRPESREAIQPERVDKQIGVFGTFMRLLWTSTLLWWVALGVFSDRIGLRRLRCALTFQSYTPYPWHVALRRTFERLGPAYIKFG